MDELPMHQAAKEGDLEKVRKLVNGGVSVDSRDDQGRTPLHRAAEEGRYEVVDFLCGLPECDLNLKDGEGYTPVLLAANSRRKNIVDLLLQRGAQVNCADDKTWTLLHHASCSGWPDLVQYLLNRGEGDVNAATEDGDTPLMWAAEEGHEEVAVLLLQAGTDVHQRDAIAGTALHSAAWNGHTKVVQVLLEVEGLDLNPQDYQGYTPLHDACSEGHLAVIQQLLVAGADTTIKNNDGEVALSVGIRRAKLTLEEIGLFVQHGASFEDCDYVRISQNPDLKEGVFKDVDLVTQSILNKINRQSLSALKCIPHFAGKLPSIVDMLGSNAHHIRDVGNSAKCDLQTHTSLNVVEAKARPKVLRIVCKLTIIVVSLFLTLPVTWYSSAALVVKG